MDAYSMRRRVKSALGDNQGALSDHNKAIELNSGSLDAAYAGHGTTKYRLGDKQGALSDYSKAVELQPKNANFYKNLAITKRELGDKQGAISDFKKVMSIDPKYVDAYLNLGIIYGTENKQEAIASFREAAKLYKQENKIDAYRYVLNQIAQLEK